MAVEQRRGLGIGAHAVVEDLAELDDGEVREFLGEDGAEAHLALLVAAVGERAGEERDLGRARPEQAAEDVAGEAAGLAVVDADIGGARHVEDVGREGDDRGAVVGEGAHRLADRGVVEGDQADAVGFAVQARGGWRRGCRG